MIPMTCLQKGHLSSESKQIFLCKFISPFSPNYFYAFTCKTGYLRGSSCVSEIVAKKNIFCGKKYLFHPSGITFFCFFPSFASKHCLIWQHQFRHQLGSHGTLYPVHRVVEATFFVVILQEKEHKRIFVKTFIVFPLNYQNGGYIVVVWYEKRHNIYHTICTP